MDPNEDNSEIPDSPFSFMWLLFGDDWDLWDTYSPVDADDISPDPTLDVNGDGPAIEPGSLLRTISWETTFEQDSLQSWNDEQSETTSVVEYTDVSSHGNTFTNEEETLERYWRNWLQSSTNEQSETGSQEEYTNASSHGGTFIYEEETLEQYWRNWLQSSTNEQFETESLEEYTNPSSHGDIFTYEELLSITDETGDERTGLSEEVIDENLIRRKYEKRSDDETKRCVICQQKLKDNEEVSKLGCGHDFHFGCIKNWLMVTNKCPLCNREVV
ncbi:unnamed protein product [Arabidopsis thaliana]|uniref:RING-type E3 ubiquitin transferase n=2 Tax=Arabidopsis thaliana TaxID=3702 RepID=Q9FHA1_ARATH|nr:RING/U-box superfamily protein [Arabidopsis thaliana]AED98304.1 RING/U-box superfamily protein [Arabidopsis thaliana]BAB10946.1 unnamed protein product [Arabidopsis thaliana]CAA0412609.1 unnamed protein product [Arabidopsis thaliana]|eukprot:NP_201513.1 RING/U-box superfamily protein [Arabidopsis thaliana]